MKTRYLPDEKFSLWLFFSIISVYALVYMTKNCFSAAMVMLVEDGILTKSQTGTISAVFYLLYAPFQIIGGIAADKYSPFKLIAIGLVGAAIVNVLIVLNPNYYFMLAAWAINGLVQFGIWPSIFKIASGILAPQHRQKAMFYSSMSGSMGLVISYILAGIVPDWKSNFTVAAVTLFICSVYWIISGKMISDKMIENNSFPNGYEVTEKIKDNAEIKLLPLLFRSGMMLILPVVILQSVLSLGVQALMPSLIAENYESVSASLASIMTVIPLIVSIIGKVLMDYIYKKMHHTECSVMTVCFLILIPILAPLLMIGKINVGFVVLLISICLLISNGITLLIVTYFSSRFIKFGKSGTLSGIINCMMSLGIVIANLVSTRMADTFGWNSVIVSWIAFAAVSGIFGIISYFPWKKFIKSL